jgi:tetratricopeptide (TPR) repeat protein
VKVVPKLTLASALVLAAVSCGTRETSVSTFIIVPGTSPDLGCSYTWQQDDTWKFMAWAVLDSPGAADVLALESGYRPDSLPRPGTEVSLPVAGGLESELSSRMAAARLVRTATDHRESGDDPGAFRALQEAAEADPSWSVPLCDMAIMLLEEGNCDAAADILEPVAYKYRPSLILSRIAWEEGRSDDALSYLQTALSGPDPPAEALAAAALLYTVTGNGYAASAIWLRILAQPDADSRLRLMAVRFALLESRRASLQGLDP